MKPQVSLVIPLYNEESVFRSLITRITAVIEKAPMSCEVVLIDDGSSDATQELMTDQAKKDTRFHCVFLSRNFGHQIALSAGMSRALGSEALFILDGDLQDPPELLEEFYTHLKNGNDVVYAIRKKRKESYLKKLAYSTFYRFLDKISYVKIPLDSGDFSMISRRVTDILVQMPEQSRYIRGMRSWSGFNQIGVPYERDAREEGNTKYAFKHLLKRASEGIFNFSEFPIRFITRLGAFSVLISIVYLFTVLYKRIAYDAVPEGFTALLIAIIMFSGVILISIGIIGEYILRIFFQSKQRPLFLIDKEIINGEETK